MKRILLSMMVLAFGLILAAFLVESTFRVALLKPFVPESIEDLEEVTRRWPEPRELRKADGVFRVVCIGDSFGVAGGAKNFHYLAEQHLREGHPDIEFVNLSLPELELLDEFQLYRNIAFRFQPDLILHSVFIGNDFQVPAGELVSFKGLTVRRLARGWASITWLKRYLQQRSAVLENERRREAGDPVGLLGEKGFLDAERARMERCNQVAINPEVTWEYMGRIFDKFVGLARKLEVPYVVVLHPDQYQVEKPLQEQLFGRYQLEPSNYDFNMPQRFLETLMAERGVPCLDLLELFREQGGEGGLYRLHDTHYNEAGNRLAAETLARFLEERILSVSAKM